ncbi:MAG: hypothetical protein LUD17_15900 [Bacteroidales bacterium]|nr:hypothetical protein [Bacteroidales bacterium]
MSIWHLRHHKSEGDFWNLGSGGGEEGLAEGLDGFFGFAAGDALADGLLYAGNLFDDHFAAGGCVAVDKDGVDVEAGRKIRGIYRGRLGSRSDGLGAVG